MSHVLKLLNAEAGVSALQQNGADVSGNLTAAGETHSLQVPINTAYSEDEVLRKGIVQKYVTMQRHEGIAKDWTQRYLQLTPTRLLLSFAANAPIREEIQLTNIDIVKLVDEENVKDTLNDELVHEAKPKHDTNIVLSNLEWIHCIRIFVAKYRRNYYLRAESQEEADEWINAISEQKRLIEEQQVKASQKTIFQKIRPPILRVIDSMRFQSFVALLLCVNFCLNIYEVEMQPEAGSDITITLDLVDDAFTVFYTVELALNLYAHWWRDFVCNGWSIFDAICVLTSLVGMLMSVFMTQGLNLNVIRSIRIFKIVRIFSRLEALQRIVSAITSTLFPLFNTFLIFLVVVAIYAVLGSQIYGELKPERFGTFSASSLTMFQLATGDAWLTDIVRPLMEAGYQEQGARSTVLASMFFISYILMVGIVLINVAVAVLLEGFLNAIAALEAKERAKESAIHYDKIAGPFDPLLATLANFQSQEHLCSQISVLFKHCDIDDGGTISFDEFKAGIEGIDLKPQMFVAREDFDTFTLGGQLCLPSGEIDYESFDRCVRLQLKNYAQRIVAHKMVEAIRMQHSESTQLFANKVLLSEIFTMASTLRTLAENFNLGYETPSVTIRRGKDEREICTLNNVPGSVEDLIDVQGPKGRFLGEEDEIAEMQEERAKEDHTLESREEMNENMTGSVEAVSLMTAIQELKDIVLDIRGRVERCENVLAADYDGKMLAFRGSVQESAERRASLELAPVPPTMVEETAAGTKSPPPASVSSAEKGAEVDADPQPPNPPPRSQATTALLESALAQDDNSDQNTFVQNANRKHREDLPALELSQEGPVGKGFVDTGFKFGDLPFSSDFIELTKRADKHSYVSNRSEPHSPSGGTRPYSAMGIWARDSSNRAKPSPAGRPVSLYNGPSRPEEQRQT